MPKFRKKPVIIEARHFTGEPDSELELWLGDSFETWLPSKRQLVIRTVEPNEHTASGGDWSIEHTASAGDWIIKGVQGEFYACKPDIFEATYDPAG